MRIVGVKSIMCNCANNFEKSCLEAQKLYEIEESKTKMLAFLQILLNFRLFFEKSIVFSNPNRMLLES